MKKTFIVIIWHQAGGRNENRTFYTWSDEKENTITFESHKDAENKWKDSGMRDIHAGFVVECTPQNVYWI